MILPTPCGGTGPPATSTYPLSYIWSVYAGAVRMNNIVSISKDPRYFKLPPYTLDIGIVYIIQVYIQSTDPLLSPAYAQVTVQVLPLGVQAYIIGMYTIYMCMCTI